LLCQQIDLQIEMSPLVGLARPSVLRHQHEYRQEDRFERDHEREGAERIGVEWLEAKKMAGVDHQPSREPAQMDESKGSASRRLGDSSLKRSVV
jgi:hypothetical protein